MNPIEHVTNAWNLLGSQLSWDTIAVQFIIYFCRYFKVFFANGLVNMSANYYVVSTLSTRRILALIVSLKCYYLTAMYLVLCLFLGTLANSSAPLLSSKGVHFVFNSSAGIFRIFLYSKTKSFKGNTSLAAVDIILYFRS